MLWVLLLAGGSGSRLAQESLRLFGFAKSKQYCDFGGGTLLELTLARARRFAPDRRIVVVTTRTHRTHALEVMRRCPLVGHLELPLNRDTTSGILLPMLHVRALDPHASVIVMPTDHAVTDEELFCRTVSDSIAVLSEGEDIIALLAAEPSGSDADYGWVVPTPGSGRWPAVARFREKPNREEVVQLRTEGGLINTLVMSGRAATFERAIAHRAPACHRELITKTHDEETLAMTFERLTPSSFSRDVLEHIPGQLRIVPLPEEAGWSDVGTPERLAQVIWPAASPSVAALAPALLLPD